jgi:hypothetical protein
MSKAVDGDASQAAKPAVAILKPSKGVVGFGGYRWAVCALLFAATTVNYFDCQILGILAPTFEKTIGCRAIHNEELGAL